MLPQQIAIPHDCDRTVQPMGLSRERHQMIRRISHVARLVKDPVAKRHGLVRPDDQGARKAAAYLFRFGLR